MEIKEVIKYEVYGRSFNSLAEAQDYSNRIEVRNSLSEVISNFYYTDCDEEDVLEGILQYKEDIVRILNEYSK